VVLSSEFYAGRPDVADFDAYLKLENKLFDELRERVVSRAAPEDRSSLNRYVTGSLSDPENQSHNWNRSFHSIPPQPKGSVVLIHGLTDSPYTMHAVAELFVRQGYAVFVPRMPGHGTIPGALRKTKVGRLDGGGASRLPGGVEIRRAGKTVPHVRLLERRSAGGEVHARYDGGRKRARAGPADLVRAGDRADAFRRVRELASNSFDFSLLQKIEWLEIAPEYDPFQVQLFSKNGGRSNIPVNADRQSAARSA